jgi:hypothetical protein
MNTRAKFQCTSVKKYKSGVWDAEAKKVQDGFLYSYEFYPVTSSGTDENKKFFASTPSGNLELTAVREDLFVPGQYYYLDFSDAQP